MGKWKISHKERNKDPIKYYKSVAFSIGKILKESPNQEFRNQSQSILGIRHLGEVEQRILELMTHNEFFVRHSI